MLPTTEIEDRDTTHGSTPEPPSPDTSRWSGLITAAAMLILGVGLGWLLFSGSPESEIPPVTEPPAVAAESDADAAVEPVAAVAESLLPSVVQIETRGGLGSGVIYDSSGLILTAAHVVAGESEVVVRLSDGTQYEGEVLGGDLPTDIAVVQVDGENLPAAPLDLDGDVEVGQLAVAIGSPYGLDSTVTSGVVSAINQTVGSGGNFQSLIQTDAAINPGNSGGALANRDGEVIGINVSIFSRSGGNDGVGFAVPIDVAHDLADSVVQGEPLSRPVLGVTGTNAESGRSGALITEVSPGSGADEAGIEAGDVIVAIDGIPVSGIADVAAQVRAHRPGDSVTVELLRSGEEMQLEVTLGS